MITQVCTFPSSPPTACKEAAFQGLHCLLSKKKEKIQIHFPDATQHRQENFRKIKKNPLPFNNVKRTLVRILCTFLESFETFAVSGSTLVFVSIPFLCFDCKLSGPGFSFLVAQGIPLCKGLSLCSVVLYN